LSPSFLKERHVKKPTRVSAPHADDGSRDHHADCWRSSNHESDFVRRTGMSGRACCANGLVEPAFERVLVVGRSPTGIAESKRKKVLHGEFHEFLGSNRELQPGIVRLPLRLFMLYEASRRQISNTQSISPWWS